MMEYVNQATFFYIDSSIMGQAGGVRKMSAYIILGFLSYLAPPLKMSNSLPKC